MVVTDKSIEENGFIPADSGQWVPFYLSWSQGPQKFCPLSCCEGSYIVLLGFSGQSFGRKLKYEQDNEMG